MLRVGLTGGIACGKSHVLREFHKLGVYTVDADQIAHDAVLPGKPAHQAIVETFGQGILAKDGTIDRKKLGKLVFSDEQSRQRLNQIVHPFVFAEEDRLISDFQAEGRPTLPIVMVDAALMIETGSYRNYDFVIVVYCRPEIQLRRLMAREDFSEEEAELRIKSQMPLLDKVRNCDYVIENSGRLSHTNEQVRQVFTELVNCYEEGE